MATLYLKKTLSLLEPHHHPFQLLIATLLSSRSKDSTTIPIVKRLFKIYPQAKNLLAAKLTDLEKILYGVGFYHTKARHLKELSKIVLEKYNGTIPETFPELITLPGVGRKTANCILGYAFQQPAIAVDTHVHRISNRLGWIKTTTPEESELALQKVVPQELWTDVNRLLVDHGQRICLPINPQCRICPVNKYCQYGKKVLKC